MANVDEIYTSFLEQFDTDIPTMKGMPTERVVELAGRYQENLAKQFECDAFVRQIDPKVVDELLDLSKTGYLQILMRHGEQQKSDKVLQASDQGMQKIMMMQAEENMTNPITESSAIESLSTLIVLKYLHDNSEGFKVESSSNLRASIPANSLAKLLGVETQFDPKWNCINYPSDKTPEALLASLPNGTLPWPTSSAQTQAVKLVDDIAGEGTYQNIVDGVQQALARDDANYVTITHTQQIAQAIGQNIRLENFGFMVHSASSDDKVYENGIYSADKPKLRLNFKVADVDGHNQALLLSAGAAASAESTERAKRPMLVTKP